MAHLLPGVGTGRDRILLTPGGCNSTRRGKGSGRSTSNPPSLVILSSRFQSSSGFIGRVGGQTGYISERFACNHRGSIWICRPGFSRRFSRRLGWQTGSRVSHPHPILTSSSPYPHLIRSQSSPNLGHRDFLLGVELRGPAGWRVR